MTTDTLDSMKELDEGKGATFKDSDAFYEDISNVVF
jgi:hypothetical protein